MSLKLIGSMSIIAIVYYYTSKQVMRYGKQNYYYENIIN